jgi:hypothetical protein
MAMKTSRQLLDIGIHCVMPLFEEVVIGFKSRDVLIAPNTKYVGCDYMMCYLVHVKGNTFWNVVFGKLRWLNMEKSCAYLHVTSSSYYGWSN